MEEGKNKRKKSERRKERRVKILKEGEKME